MWLLLDTETPRTRFLRPSIFAWACCVMVWLTLTSVLLAVKAVYSPVVCNNGTTSVFRNGDLRGGLQCANKNLHVNEHTHTGCTETGTAYAHTHTHTHTHFFCVFWVCLLLLFTSVLSAVKAASSPVGCNNGTRGSYANPT